MKIARYMEVPPVDGDELIEVLVEAVPGTSLFACGSVTDSILLSSKSGCIASGTKYGWKSQLRFMSKT